MREKYQEALSKGFKKRSPMENPGVEGIRISEGSGSGLGR